jgi:hypothetical protein
MASDVIYARDVIYGRAYLGPRGAQRHRKIRGPAQSFAAPPNRAAQHARHLRRAIRRHVCGKRHLCGRRHLWSDVPRTAWRAAPSRYPGSSAKIAAQRLTIFLKNWIPDLRGGFAAACPGYADVIYAKNVIYGRDVIYAAGRRPSRRIAKSIARRGRHHYEIADAD